MIPTDLAFETPRVRARLLREDDLDLYLALYMDPEVMRHVGAALSVDAIRELFAKVVASNRRQSAAGRYWGIVHRRTGAWLGQASLIRDAADPICAEVGIMLLPSAQHRGVGLQVLRALVDMALEGRIWPGVRELVSRNAEENLSAARLVAHVGFRPCNASAEFACWRLSARHEDT